MKMAAGFNRQALRVRGAAVPSGLSVALDIGGSLAKVAWVEKKKGDRGESEVPLNLLTFETEQLLACLEYLRENIIASSEVPRGIWATGVGCMMHQEQIMSALNVMLHTDDQEMWHTTKGLSILWDYLPPEELLTDGSDTGNLHFRTDLATSHLTPCNLVNLGSAMTSVLVRKDGSMGSVVAASSMGGLSFLGLGALMTSARTFNELVCLAERGDRRNVDLLVKDTAGSCYNHASADSMVSSFGKAAKQRLQGKEMKFHEEDIASSIMYAVTDNLAQQCFFSAQSQGVKNVCFCGSFLANNRTVQNQIQQKFQCASEFLGTKIRPVFIKQPSYLGVIGVLFNSFGHSSPPRQETLKRCNENGLSKTLYDPENITPTSC